MISKDSGASSTPFIKGASSAKVESGNVTNSEQYFTRSTSQTLKAIAILFLILGHFNVFCMGGTAVVKEFGEWGVLIFLIVSGMGLVKSYSFNNCEKLFIRRRFSKIMLPLWMTLVLFYFLDFFLLNTTYPWQEIALSFVGILNKAPPNPPLWFIPFILYLYGVFWLISNIRLPVHSKCLLLILAAFGTTGLITRVPVLLNYFGGWTTYTYAFPLSVCLMVYRRVLILKFLALFNRFRLTIFTVWLAVGALFIMLDTARTPFFVIFVAISVFYLDRMKSKPKLLLLLGEHSYELYLIHFPFLAAYGFVIGREPVVFFGAIYCVCTLLGAAVMKKGCGWLGKAVGRGSGCRPVNGRTERG